MMHRYTRAPRSLPFPCAESGLRVPSACASLLSGMETSPSQGMEVLVLVQWLNNSMILLDFFLLAGSINRSYTFKTFILLFSEHNVKVLSCLSRIWLFPFSANLGLRSEFSATAWGQSRPHTYRWSETTLHWHSLSINLFSSHVRPVIYV